MHIQRGAWAEINLDAVAHNVQMAKANLKPTTKLCAAPSRQMPMVMALCA